MLRNYIKVALRNIVRYKTYSVINVLGLAIGIACVMIILMVAKTHLSFESHNAYSERIHRINKKYSMKGDVNINTSTPYPLRSAAVETIPEVFDAAHFVLQTANIESSGEVNKEYNVCFTSPSVFNIFTFDFISGNPDDAIIDHNSVAIAEAMAEKYFGDEDPIGRTLSFNNRTDRTVSAVFKDITKFSDYRFDFVLNMDIIAPEEDRDYWYDHWMETFVLVAENSDMTVVENKVDQLMKTNVGDQSGAILQPLKKIHLYSPEGTPTIQKYIQIFLSIAALILIIAVFNFMNLATAQATKRSREVGLRKVSGASKSSLIKQFTGESVLYTIISSFVALIIMEISLPVFEKISGIEMSLRLFSLSEIFIIICFVIILGIISGSYPAFVMSSFSPVKVLKSNLKKGKKGFKMRTAIVIIQFIIAVFLISGTGAIYSQLKFMQNKDLGFDKENLIYMRLNNNIENRYETFKQKCEQIPGVINLSRTSSRPDAVWNIMRGMTWEGDINEESSAFAFVSADPDFVKTMKLDIAKGRDFSEDFASDENAVIINEAAVKMMGVENPVGLKIGDDGNEIIGVVKDFNSLPLNYEMEPLLITNIPDYYSFLFIRITGDNPVQITDNIKEVWNELAPESPFSFRFLNETFQSTYESEITAGLLFKIFASLGIFISCLGLFGLVSFITEQKKIRKVVGSTSLEVVRLLSLKFILWVFIANLIAFPISRYFMSKWLESFVYRTPITPMIFVFAGVLSIFITLFAVSFKILKAANSNPVEALKYE